MFVAVCTFFARGTQTILISRWRTGGQTSVDLVREFAQELPHMPAAEAWQRSVLLATEAPIDPSLEPRVAAPDRDEKLTAGHPFFWAGYVLAGTGDVEPDQRGEPAETKDEPPSN
jgi:CHAT domain-containing protein